MLFLGSARRAMYAAGEALFPKNELGAPDFESTQLAARTEQYIALLPPPQQRLMWLLFIFLEFFAPVLALKVGRYSRLSIERRLEVVRGFRSSRFYAVKLIGDAVKAVFTMIYLSHPLALRHIGMYAVCKNEGDALEVDVKSDALEIMARARSQREAS